jgi:peroxiredoxin
MNSDELQRQLDTQREAAKKHSPDLFANVESANQQLYEMGILESALKLGDTAPDFSLPNAFGSRVHMRALLRRGPVVLTFYRGDWCPYCNMTLRAYQTILPDLLNLNAALVAVSPQNPKHALGLTAKHHLAYQVLSDTANHTARDYRLVYKMPDILRRAYKLRGHDMIKEHGSWELPLPATFIIDKESTIRYRFLKIDYTERAEPAEILSVLRGIQ